MKSPQPHAAWVRWGPPFHHVGLWGRAFAVLCCKRGHAAHMGHRACLAQVRHGITTSAAPWHRYGMGSPRVRPPGTGAWHGITTGAAPWHRYGMGSPRVRPPGSGTAWDHHGCGPLARVPGMGSPRVRPPGTGTAWDHHGCGPLAQVRHGITMGAAPWQGCLAWDRHGCDPLAQVRHGITTGAAPWHGYGMGSPRVRPPGTGAWHGITTFAAPRHRCLAEAHCGCLAWDHHLCSTQARVPGRGALWVLGMGSPGWDALPRQAVFDFLSQRHKKLCHFILDIMDYFLAGDDQQKTNQPSNQAGG